MMRHVKSLKSIQWFSTITNNSPKTDMACSCPLYSPIFMLINLNNLEPLSPSRKHKTPPFLNKGMKR